ncbi:MAG: N-acetyltransferase [Pseudomonadota bacterium]
MGAPYETATGLQSPLIQTGLSLIGSRLNPLVLMSDPERTPDLLTLAKAMPSGSAIIYRHFGKPGLEDELRSITTKRSIQLLIGNDPELVERCGADGVHFSRRTKPETIQYWRARQPDWIVSAAAPKPWSTPPYSHLLDVLFVSSVFPSSSPSAGEPFGIDRLKEITAASECPVFALGGITDHNAGQLGSIGIAGVAAISGLKDTLTQSIKKVTVTMEPSQPPDKPSLSITKDEGPAGIVFTAEVSGATHTGELTLVPLGDGLWNANHTGVPKEIGGRGVGKALVKAMVEDARISGYKVVPGCPFVAKLFKRHPDWADGVAV